MPATKKRAATRRKTAPRPLSDYPHLSSDPAILGGTPVIEGTRISVRGLAECVQSLGYTPEDLLVSYPHLTLAQIHAALTYYYDHQAEVDAEIALDNDFDALNALTGGRLIRFG